MNWMKVFAVLMGFFTLSAFGETLRIAREERASLIPMAVVISLFFGYLTIRLWKKGKWG